MSFRMIVSNVNGVELFVTVHHFCYVKNLIKYYRQANFWLLRKTYI